MSTTIKEKLPTESDLAAMQYQCENAATNGQGGIANPDPREFDPPQAIEEPQFEVLPPDVKSASTELSCPADKVAALYAPFEKPFEYAAELLAEEEKATTAFDARALRLRMVKARTTITATKDESKSDIKIAGNIIDWFHNKGRDRLTAAEARLLDIEKAEERAEAARIEALREERAETLDSMGHNYHGISLGTMTDEAWTEYLQQAKDVYEMREIRKKREAEEAAAEAKRQEEEREAQRLEAIRLREEAAAAAAALEAERNERAAALEAARIEREEMEAKAKADREAAEAKAKAEREALEAKAAKEREAAEAKAKKEAAARAKAEAEAKALRDAEAKRIADAKAAEAAKAKAEAAAAKKAAAAPDKAKMIDFADMLRHLNPPTMKSPEAESLSLEVKKQLGTFAKWIEDQVSSL